ncbi:MAG: L-lactate dehydrogenase [Oscillibacter sp.]|nr:L-lactate dehydrogenase [Oscillibacter sp.]MBD5169893.1 L-lactate dehydrogenase [Oscillibacter sp.]
MGRKVTIIGAGSVGASIANDMVVTGTATDILLIDIDENKAFGEAMDIYQGTSFGTPAVVRSGGYEDAADSAIVIITSGLPRKPGQTRLDLAQTNVNILKDIASKVVPHAPDAIYIIVSNPVDVMTYVFHKISGVPANRIIGSGTVLDTARLQAELAKQFHISPKNVHAHVYGEHGDSSFIPWSLVTIANNHVSKFKGHAPHNEEIEFDGDYAAVEEKVRTSGAVVIKAKGVTNYAVAMAVCHIVRCIFNGAGTALTVSTMMNGEYGISDVCLSVLNLVDDTGVRGKISNDLTEEELAKLRNSADKLKETIAAITY